MTRDELGKIVRDAWIEWAKQQPNPKTSWLVPYEELEEPDKEADRMIAEAVLAAMEPRWSREWPKEPGWYWVRGPGNQSPRIDYVHDDTFYRYRTVTTDEFAGPLYSPKETR